jgi:cell division protein FtsQ
MDRRGRFAESLDPRQAPEEGFDAAPPSRFSLFLRRATVRAKQFHFLRGAGFISVAAIFAVAGGYGAIKGGHLDQFYVSLHNAADQAAQAVGLDTAQVMVSGTKRLKREDVLRAAGIAEKSTLFLIDAAKARAALLQNPWIADAEVRKLYPDRLEIKIEEKKAYAIWQNKGQYSVIAKDGTVIDQIDVKDIRNSSMPFVVGAGAEKKAAELYALLARFPAIKSEVAAAVMVGERRWNLRLKSGLDIRLPDEDADVALLRLVALDRDDKILSRDITVIDLREADRVTVRLSDEAKAARDAAFKDMKKKKGKDT